MSSAAPAGAAPSTGSADPLPTADQLLAAQYDEVHRRTDRLFAGLMVFQWLAGLAAAVFVSPVTWAGASSSVHPHVLAAFVIGGLLTVYPVFLVLRRPGEVLTRHAIAVAQMLMSALLIHLTGGRIETHFHVFGSLAFLAFYRDWRVLITATVVVAADHFVRGVYFPRSVFGVVTAGSWRWVEHAAWVVFEDIFLVTSCLWSRREMRGIAEREARLREIGRGFEEAVAERTSELASSEERFRALSAQSPVGVYQTDATGRCTYVNPRWQTMFGLTAEEARDEGWTRSLHPEDRERVLRCWEETVGETGAFDQEFRLLTASGSVVWVRSRANVQLGSDGRRTGFVGTVEDNTTRRLAEQALQVAREQAESATRAKSEFLANMSHEIRTPMNGVIGMTGLLLDTSLNAEQKEYSETIRRSADHLLTVINDILDFSRIEAGKLLIEPIPFDLQLAVEEVGELLAPRAEEKGVELLIRYEPGAPRRVVGDPGRIRQVLVNLAGNAVKFTEAGHVFIDVSAEAAGDDIAVSIAIRDTGIGIPAEVLPKLFSQFSQADASTTRRFGGTGLGLAISKKLLELMGGAISVTSEPGVGSEFRITMTMGKAGPATENPVDTPVEILHDHRVLVVDDSIVNRRILCEQLAAWRMRPESVDSGERALHAMRAAANCGDPFGIAIIDYRMPGMDGRELAKSIGAAMGSDAPPLVMLTSSAQRGDAQRFAEAGFAAYLVKPVRLSVLIQTLAMACRRHREGHRGDLITRHSVSEAAARARELIRAGKSRPGNSADPEPSPRGRIIRVLVAEDNVVNQRVAVRMLEKCGCRVDVAANGSEALQMAKQLPYDLIFMDCQMPEMDGYEATRSIRRHEAGERRVPIVAMTAGAMQGDRELCLDAGMDDYIAKPVRSQDFINALDRFSA